MINEICDHILANNWLKKIEQIQLLTGDASGRKYFRVMAENKTYIICDDKTLMEKKEDHAFLVMQKILAENKISIPDVLQVDFKNGLIMQSDLGDITLLSHLATANENDVLKMYQIAIESQLKINLIVASSINKNFEPFVLKFDSVKLMQEMDLTIKHFFRSYLEIYDENLLLLIREELVVLVKEIEELPTCLVHRDFHSRNIMVQNNNLFIIDFQDARQGIPQYDLVSLVDDCYSKISENGKEYLKKYYFSRAKEEGLMKVTQDEFEYQYKLMKIQRTLKAIGSFCFINDTKNNPRYLKYVGYAFNNIREVIIGDQKLKNLKKLVQNYYEK